MAARQQQPVLACRFYKSLAGNEPVRVWLKAQSDQVKKAIGADIKTVQWSWPVGKPLVDGFGSGLYEVRSSVDGDIFRVMFCLEGSTMVLLHAFQKKTQQTPQSEIKLARKRMAGD